MLTDVFVPSCEPRKNPNRLCVLAISFESRIAKALGFEPRRGNNTSTPDGHTYTPTYIGKCAPRLDSGTEYFYHYSNISARSRFGSSLVNFLNTIPYRTNLTKAGSPMLQKPLLNKKTDSIAMRITDQNRRNVMFLDNNSVTAVVHVRPR